ncbi:hypothetical protein COCC4DRAFT_27189 [Bipolaris maydis ATCC 48331]|uniref:Uncharacterized protein n=2 Tax=Cochliobolus heterostrophus TaxID=5016 RepID=M2TCA2_COCH5|nr:uncharacterized protein COCC4DRAFT_27189 [Bipolaris maydis ATCC 48331]EMD95170.1 hypothetical protein COCHEDRAFT_1027658 [Bipolaris maydis C5]ENI00938.1 hypothetical protein COCC4DRAFT_27189 [Bipolaris maydis ATCC 48331]KAH7551222.1 hypothetical protein BM1_10096 [Bipolaris maydis]
MGGEGAGEGAASGVETGNRACHGAAWASTATGQRLTVSKLAEHMYHRPAVAGAPGLPAHWPTPHTTRPLQQRGDGGLARAQPTAADFTVGLQMQSTLAASACARVRQAGASRWCGLAGGDVGMPAGAAVLLPLCSALASRLTDTRHTHPHALTLARLCQ